MNTDDIIKLAREAGIEWQENSSMSGKKRMSTAGSQSIERIEHFAALVTQAERESRQAAQAENEELKARLARSGVELRAAVRAEREACHALRQTLPNPMAHCQTSAHAYDMAIVDYGKAIRARNHVVDANKMPSQPDCTDCDCADNDPCKAAS